VLDIANSHLLGSEEECEQLDRLIPSREIPTVFIGKESVSGREPADENISVFGKLDGVSAGDASGGGERLSLAKMTCGGVFNDKRDASADNILSRSKRLDRGLCVLFGAMFLLSNKCHTLTFAKLSSIDIINET
jgi:hypothetical protein